MDAEIVVITDHRHGAGRLVARSASSGPGRRAGLQAGDELEAAREASLLSGENAELKSQVSRLEERIAVLERIATDPAQRTAREIEELR